MYIALIPLKTQIKKRCINIQRFVDVAKVLIVQTRLDLIILPECSFTGYLYEAVDLERYTEPIPGPSTERIAQFAREWQIDICFGLIERMADGIFNSAVLISGDGKIRMVQRKVSEKPPYATRQQVKIMQTKFGKVAILICGDLFDNETVQQVPPDTRMVIVPMARGFDRQSSDSKRWKNEERQAYQKDARSSNKNINRP